MLLPMRPRPTIPSCTVYAPLSGSIEPPDAAAPRRLSSINPNWSSPTSTTSAMPRNNPVPTTPGIARNATSNAGRIGDGIDAAIEDGVAVVREEQLAVRLIGDRIAAQFGQLRPAQRQRERHDLDRQLAARAEDGYGLAWADEDDEHSRRGGDDLLAHQRAAVAFDADSDAGSTSSAPSTVDGQRHTLFQRDERNADGLRPSPPNAARSARRGRAGRRGRGRRPA